MSSPPGWLFEDFDLFNESFRLSVVKIRGIDFEAYS